MKPRPMVHCAGAFDRHCFKSNRFDDYEQSLRAMEDWFRPTGTPALIAKCDRLAALAALAHPPHSRAAALLQDAIPTAAAT